MGLRRWVRSHPGWWYGFFIVWCGYWAGRDADFALHAIVEMVNRGGATSILWATWDVIVIVAFLVTLRLNCVWYARARRRNRRGEEERY